MKATPKAMAVLAGDKKIPISLSSFRNEHADALGINNVSRRIEFVWMRGRVKAFVEVRSEVYTYYCSMGVFVHCVPYFTFEQGKTYPYSLDTHLVRCHRATLVELLSSKEVLD